MKMQNTEIEFITFDTQDVITTSSTGGGDLFITISNFFDGEAGNGSVMGSNGVEYFDGYDVYIDGLRELFDVSEDFDLILYDGGDYQGLDGGLNQYMDSSSEMTAPFDINGVWKWIQDNERFEMQ